LTAAAHGEALVRKQGPVTITLSAANISDGKSTITLSGELILTLQVEGAAPVVVKPGNRVVGEAWEVTLAAAPTIIALAGKSERWEQVLRVEPKLLPGEHKLQVAAIEYQLQGSVWQKSAEQEFVVVVTTSVAPDGKPIGPPPRIEELPVPESIHWPI